MPSFVGTVIDSRDNVVQVQTNTRAPQIQPGTQVTVQFTSRLDDLYSAAKAQGQWGSVGIAIQALSGWTMVDWNAATAAAGIPPTNPTEAANAIAALIAKQLANGPQTPPPGP